MVTDVSLPEDSLSLRQREILRTLIEEYITAAAPVGSATLQQLSRLGVSSATIRNELATLETMGYVAQPYTSAGRIPTVKGYRYFVEQLMDQADLPVPEQRMIRHQFHQIRLDLDQWLRLTAAVLAHASRAAALVTRPHSANSRFKHLELISIKDTLCLMILVLQDGSIHQEMLELPEFLDQATLSEASNRLNDWLSDRSAPDIEQLHRPEMDAFPAWERLVWQRVLFLMKQADQLSVSEIYRDGLLNILCQPEFAEADKVRQVVQILEGRNLLESVLERIMNASGIQIIIGGEGIYEEIDDVSLVLSPYGIKGSTSGILGVVGPIRMPYGRAISAVRYVAQLMDSLVADMYGE